MRICSATRFSGCFPGRPSLPPAPTSDHHQFRELLPFVIVTMHVYALSTRQSSPFAIRGDLVLCFCRNSLLWFVLAWFNFCPLFSGFLYLPIFRFSALQRNLDVPIRWLRASCEGMTATSESHEARLTRKSQTAAGSTAFFFFLFKPMPVQKYRRIRYPILITKINM